ncbi:hypothetical protein SAMN04488018_11065 [Myroides marinus]|uniref:Uncharacterized protein n=1 Tax=Myroides marinus TaxID=703342 RepID=A0A1H6VYG3_9FLAO|nr:hypothetical protein SAMN04488018_11065 [Myroides marinus]
MIIEVKKIEIFVITHLYDGCLSQYTKKAINICLSLSAFIYYNSLLNCDSYRFL